MRLDIRSNPFPLTEAIKSHAEARVQAAIAPFAPHVRAVRVRLWDINSHRGGVDKRASIVALLDHHGPVVATSQDEDLYVAITDAAMRLRRAGLRAVKRHRAGQRRDPQRPGALLVA